MKIAIVHETDGRKYFAAIDNLEKTNKISSIDYIQGRCLRNLGRDILKLNINPRIALRKFFTAWRQRLSFPFVKYDLAVIAFGPYDFRFIYYALFCRAKRIITHTSWPDWSDNPPVQYGALTKVNKCLWHLIFKFKHIECVAVTEPAKRSFNENYSVKTTVIPHAISKQFAADNYSKKTAHICFVGELSDSKGILTLIEISKKTTKKITIVGSGPLAETINNANKQLPNIIFLGPINDRLKLAAIVASHRYLIVPSQRTEVWQELFGIVIIEAMAVGTIPICSNHAGPNGILHNQWPNLLIKEESNPDAFLDAIDLIDSDDNARKELSAALIENSYRYSIEEISEAWFKLIKGA